MKGLLSLIVLSATLYPATAVPGSKPIIVAVIDTGVYDKNPKLCKTGHYDFVSNKGWTVDLHGHGTHIAGLVASNAGEGNYCIMSLKFYSDRNSGRQNLVNTKKALRYAIDKKVSVINYSGGGPEFDEEEYLLVREALGKGIKIIASAGNEHSNLDKKCDYFPACYDKRIVMVGNLRIYRDYRNLDEVTRKLAHYAGMESKLGTVEYCKSETSNFGERVTRWEVGDNVKSTLPGGRQGYMSGTSQAAAVATGKIVKEMLARTK